jgi:Ca2+/H+ antiporter, TMEM165/GDT1 family
MGGAPHGSQPRQLASAVEFVEAIVLAMGLTRGWHSTLPGTAIALVPLSGVTAFCGYALINRFPKRALQFVVGSLLLVFGLQWLRKAILRSSGLKAMHDEGATFRAETGAARRAGSATEAGLDWFGLRRFGEDWKIAAGVAAVLVAGALLVAYTKLFDTAIALLAVAGFLGVVAASIVGGALASIRSRA